MAKGVPVSISTIEAGGLPVRPVQDTDLGPLWTVVDPPKQGFPVVPVPDRDAVPVYLADEDGNPWTDVIAVGDDFVGDVRQPIPGAGDFTLAWGNDFENENVLVRPNGPTAPIFTTRQYLPGARGSDTILGSMYDTDPFHTGHNDSNRGVAVGFTNMGVTASEMKLQARVATPAEQAHFAPTDGAINGGVRNEVAAVAHGSGAVACYPAATPGGDVVIEFRAKYTASASNPTSWHPDLWMFTLGPAFNSNEWDFEGDGVNTYYDQNLWTAGSYVGTFYGTQTAHDGNYHTFAFVLRNGGDTEWWVDGVKVANVTANSNTHSRLLSWITSSHVHAGNWKLGTYTKGSWDADANGATLTIDWIKFWNRAAAGRYKPSRGPMTLNVSHLGSGTIVIPAAATLWGDGSVTEFLQVIPHEENEPAGHHTTGLAYGVLPTGVSYASRTITVDFSLDPTGKAGRLHLALYGYKTDGSVTQPLRIVINRGPRVVASEINATVNEAMSFDIYAAIDVGRITPKTYNVTGLPAGLTLNTTTGFIEGTPTSIGTTSISVSGTNAIGQSVSANVDLIVASAGGGVFSTDFTGTPLDEITVLGFTRVDGQVGAFKIATSNMCRADSTTQTAYTAPTTGSQQQYVQVRVKNIGSAGPGAAVRLQNGDNWVYVSWSTTGYTMNQRLAGSTTVLGTRAGTAVLEDVVRLEVTTGNMARVLVNGVQAIAPAAIDSSLTAPTCGLVARLATKNPCLDDFECGPF